MTLVDVASSYAPLSLYPRRGMAAFPAMSFLGLFMGVSWESWGFAWHTPYQLVPRYAFSVHPPFEGQKE